MSRDLDAAAPVILHGTTIARRQAGQWRGVLIQGPSGSGKSDLALRALASGWRLVADDRTLVWMSGGRVFGRAPARLHGLIEARGLGVLPVGAPAGASQAIALTLVVMCVSDRALLERMPEVRTRKVLDSTLPCVELLACEASALAKMTLAFQGFRTSL